MQAVILCSEAQRQELGPVAENVVFVHALDALAAAPATVYLDLLFEASPQQHLRVLQNLVADAVIVHLVAADCTGLPSHFVRVNAWPTWLTGNIAEVAGGTLQARESAAAALALCNKIAEWTPDVPGFVSARVIAAIINEAFFTLSEGIASREAIDTAMKLGTAYPFGPFEWAEKIGVWRVAGLLEVLSKLEPRYQPCTLLEEAVKKI